MNRRSWGLRGITPLLDVLFILLFGLLALSDAKKATSAEIVRVRLPKVEPQRSDAAGEMRKIVLEVNARSEVRLEGRPATLSDSAALDAELAVLIGDALPEEFAVEIRGDAGARHGVMVALLQHLRQRGFAAVHLLALGEAGASWGEEAR